MNEEMTQKTIKFFKDNIKKTKREDAKIVYQKIIQNLSNQEQKFKILMGL